MALNIGGICFDKKLKNTARDLGKIFNVTLLPEGTLSFEAAMNDWPNEEFMDVCEFDQGTLVLCDFEYCTGAIPIKELNTLTFIHIDTSSSYSLGYAENGTIRREMMLHDGNLLQDEGVNLHDLDENKTVKELIFKLFEKVIGQSFESISPKINVHRHKIEPGFELVNPHEQTDAASEVKEHESTSFDETKGESTRANLEQTSESAPADEEDQRVESNEPKNVVLDKMQLEDPKSQEALSSQYSKEELVEFFLRLVARCQQEEWNIYLSMAGSTGAKSKILQNLKNVKDVILKQNNHSALSGIIELQDLKWLGSYTAATLDDKTSQITMRKTMLLKTPFYDVPASKIPSDKKWWKFW